MKKLSYVVLFISFLSVQFTFAQLDDINPNYALIQFTGMSNGFSTNNSNQSSSARGFFAPGFPMISACYDIKEKVYLGVMGGLEVGAAFPKPDGITALAHLNMGITAGYQFSDDLFLTFSHYLRVQASAYNQGKSDDGWVFGSTLRYKNLLLDLTKSLGPNKKSNNVILAGRMFNPFYEIFPKYVFNIKESPFWAGVRYEHFKGKYTDPTDWKVRSNVDILFGKFISF